MKELAKFMTDKATLDLQYGRHLAQLASNVHLERSNTQVGNANSLVSFFTSFQDMIRAIAHEYEVLSIKVTEQIGQPLERLGEAHLTTITRLKVLVHNCNR